MICLLTKVGRSPQEFRREGRVLSKKGKHVVRRAGNLEHPTMMSLSQSSVTHRSRPKGYTVSESTVIIIIIIIE